MDGRSVAGGSVRTHTFTERRWSELTSSRFGIVSLDARLLTDIRVLRSTTLGPDSRPRSSTPLRHSQFPEGGVTDSTSLRLERHTLGLMTLAHPLFSGKVFS